LLAESYETINHWPLTTLLLRKSTRFHDKKTLDYKSKLTHSENDQKMRCNTNYKHCAIHCKPEQRKWEIAAILVFVCTSHWNINKWPQLLRSGL